MLRRLCAGLLPCLVAIGLTGLFWPELWQGGGLIGGDIYTYFLPQKAFYADQLVRGELPFWNHQIGHGYPQLAESQTGLFYPANLLLYRCCGLNTAYVANHLLHYALAWLGCWLYGRRLSLSWAGAACAATVYTYGWFPPRACLEWAIIGGAWLSWTMWAVESALQTRQRRYAAALALFLAADLLAGHYNLAFITSLAVAFSIGWRWLASGVGAAPGNREAPQAGQSAGSCSSDGHSSGGHRTDWRWSLGLLAAVACGYGLAAPQLLPTLALKAQSQRLAFNEEFDPGYGHIPPWFLSQVVTPFLWYSSTSDPDQVLNQDAPGSIAAATNKVEAHLYFGLLPLALAVVGGLLRWRTRRPRDPRWTGLALLGLFGLVYATGWLLPVTQHLPGFGYFRGPARFGVLTTLWIAVSSGRALTDLLGQRGRMLSLICASLVLTITVADLWLVSRHQWYVHLVSDPPIDHVSTSPVAMRLQQSSHRPRVLAPGPNLAALTGSAVTPPYLGFGPALYYQPGGRLPDPTFLQWLSGDPPPRDVDVDAQFDWLRSAGVTHLLSMKRLPASWPIEPLWSGIDPFLNRAWARPSAPLYLYSLHNARGRAWVESHRRWTSIPLTTEAANEVEVQVRLELPADLVLADIPWEGWTTQINGEQVAEAAPRGEATPADPATAAASLVQRRLTLPAGNWTVRWSYWPPGFTTGLQIAAVAALLLIAGCVTGRRRSSPAS